MVVRLTIDYTQGKVVGERRADAGSECHGKLGIADIHRVGEERFNESVSCENMYTEEPMTRVVSHGRLSIASTQGRVVGERRKDAVIDGELLGVVNHGRLSSSGAQGWSTQEGCVSNGNVGAHNLGCKGILSNVEDLKDEIGEKASTAATCIMTLGNGMTLVEKVRVVGPDLS